MAYLGNTLQVAYPSYRVIDDISSQFNGVLKTFALKIGGVAPVPFPINPQQCLISVNGVIQKPDSTGAAGFTLTGTNIVFASAPSSGWAFFGTVLAGADYVNVGANFPSGSAAVPSVTFDQSTTTGLYLVSTNILGISTSGVQQLTIDSSGNVSITGIISSAAGTATNPGHKIGTGTTYAPGIYSPGTDQLALATNGTGRLFIDSSGRLGLGTSAPGAALDVAGNIRAISAAPVIYINNTSSQYAIKNSSDSFTIEKDGNERLRIDSSGRLGLGTSSPGVKFQVANDSTSYPSPAGSTVARITASSASACSLQIDAGNAASSNLYFGDTDAIAIGGISYLHATDKLQFFTNNATALTIDSSQRVGIGTTGPSASLHVNGAGLLTGAVDSATYDGGEVRLGLTTASIQNAISTQATGTPFLFFDHRGTGNAGLFVWRNGSGGGSERMRLDGSGRLLVGTSTARSNFYNSAVSAGFQLEGTGTNRRAAVIGDDFEGVLILASQKSGAVGGNTVLASGDPIGAVTFQGSDGTEFAEAASITAYVDGTPGANDMPGRLVFSTTADGASSPTERLRIGNNGDVFIGKTTTNLNTAGMIISGVGEFNIARNGDVASFNRIGTDGEIIRFFQDATQEGNISVSGTTVSYNGAHLSRWSQLPDGAEREEILRGTVLSNIDAMCSWGEEDNEQLNRMQVSNVEGDKNVSGVFQAWDDDDDTYTDDFYCAMTGDFIIRIAEGVTVERGDLLMSAGDGTAKPQDDDIVRSKTVAKVTSTHVTCTYDDGSYCVPCVLMAC